jgi:hypothetical protein
VVPPTTDADQPAFSSLFSSDRREPVSPFVRDLWSTSSIGPVPAVPDASTGATVEPVSAQPVSSAAAANVTGTSGQPGTSPGLFRFLRPDAAPGTRPI